MVECPGVAANRLGEWEILPKIGGVLTLAIAYWRSLKVALMGKWSEA